MVGAQEGPYRQEEEVAMGKGGTHGQGPSVNGSKGDYCTLSSIVNGASDDLDRPLDVKELNMDYL